MKHPYWDITAAMVRTGILGFGGRPVGDPAHPP